MRPPAQNAFVSEDPDSFELLQHVKSVCRKSRPFAANLSSGRHRAVNKHAVQQVSELMVKQEQARRVNSTQRSYSQFGQHNERGKCQHYIIRFTGATYQRLLC